MADEKGGKFGWPRHRRRQAYDGEAGRQRAEPCKIERQKIAALGRSERMQFVDDDHAKRAEKARSIAMRQHQRNLLWRGQENVGRPEALALAAGGRRIAGAGLERDRQPHLGNRLSQVAGDVDGERLQGRYIEGVDAGIRLGPTPVEIDKARQEAGQRLAAASRGDQQRVAPLSHQVEKLKLMGMGAPAARSEPAGERLRQPCLGPSLGPLFQRNHGNACLTLPFSFTNSGHRLTRSAILRCI